MAFMKLWDSFYNSFEDYLQLLPLHSKICSQLINNRIEDSPNLLTYGAVGFPQMLLVEFAISKIVNCSFPITKRSREWESFPYIETDYYFELDMAHPEATKDIQNLIQFLLDIIKNKCIYLSRHIVILKNIDVIHHNNSQAFRVILERFSTNVMFIATTNKLNMIEKPIISRMLTFRVPVPTKEEQVAILQKLVGNGVEIRYISRNLVKNIYFNETHIKKQIKKIPTLLYPPIQEFISLGNFDKFEIRKFSYKLYQHSISIPNLVIDLLTFIPDETHKMDFIKECASIELMATQADSSKMCFFIEYVLWGFINLH